MDLLKEPINLRKKKHLAAIASLILVLLILIAIPLTVFGVLKSGELNKNPKAASTVSPLIFGTNLLLNDANDQFLTSAATRQQMKNIHVSIVRMPIRSAYSTGCTSTPATWEVQAAQDIHDLGMTPIVILKYTQTDPASAGKCVVQAMNKIFGSSVVYYEFGNERDMVTDKASYTNTWNSVIPQLKAVALNGKFVGPVTSWPNNDFITYFVANANPYPDAVSYHQYTCDSSTSASACLAKIPTYKTHLDSIKADIAATGKPVPPIMLTEWNYDPIPPNPDPRVTPAFEQQYTQAMFNELANDGFFAATQYLVTGSGVYQLIDSSGNLTAEGQMFKQMYETLIGNPSLSTSLASPANGSTVSGIVNITANATPTAGSTISKVEFYIDSNLKNTVTTSPYSFAWDSTTATNGSHTILAKAYDTTGTSVSSNLVNVSVSNTPSVNTYLWIEAENSTLRSPMVNGTDTAASSGKYIYSSVSNATNVPPTNTGSAGIIVNAPVAGTYIFWARVNYGSDTANSFYAQIDGGTVYKVGNENSGYSTWKWIDWYNGDSSTSNIIKVALTAGNHTLKIIGREANTKIDKFLLTNDTSYNPSGLGNAANAGTPAPNSYLWFEAENGILASPMVTGSDSQASGGIYVYTPTTTGSDTITINVPSNDTYTLWTRVNYGGEFQNSFNAQFDGGTVYKVGNENSGYSTWKWIDWYNGETNTTNLVKVNLKAGSHTLKITGREANTKIDKFLLTTDPSYKPSGLGS